MSVIVDFKLVVVNVVVVVVNVEYAVAVDFEL